MSMFPFLSHSLSHRHTSHYHHCRQAKVVTTDMASNYLEQRTGCDRPTLSETVAEQASKVGNPFKPGHGAEFDTLTESERGKLDKQVFPGDLFTEDVNLTHSKKAFLNIMKDSSETVCEQLKNPQPHNPHTYQAPIGTHVHQSAP